MQLAERIQLRASPELSGLCHLAKNLYNEANFEFRQFFFNLGEYINYYDLQVMLKNAACYKALPAQTSQQILRLVIKNWKGFFAASKEYKRDPSKFQGRPRPPRYKEKDGESIAIFTNQNTRVKGRFIYFPKSTHLPAIKTRIPRYQQLRILPQGCGYVLEIVYNCQETNLQLNPGKVIGIDLGLNNLATIVNNIGQQPIVIKGGMAKSANQFYNKVNAHLQSTKDKQGYGFQTKKQQRMLQKRNNQMRDVFHKASRQIIAYCIQNDVGTIAVGYNAGWKQATNLGRLNNQNFVQVPFAKLVAMLEYKAKELGIHVIQQEESYTSKCSFVDGESVEKHETYSGKRLRTISIGGKRVKCNLFKRANGQYINGDVNGAYNILAQAVPNAFAEGRAGLALVPHSIAIKQTIARRMKQF